MIAKNLRKFMRYGKLVESDWTGETFKLLDDMDENMEFIKAVNTSNLRRFDLLSAWVRNWDSDSNGFRKRFEENGQDIEAVRAERESLITEVRCDDVSTADKVRFITPNYENRFEVKNLGKVLVNGKVRQVYFIDECHFGFVENGCIYHICEFAELAERNGIKVEPLK